MIKTTSKHKENIQDMSADKYINQMFDKTKTTLHNEEFTERTKIANATS